MEQSVEILEKEIVTQLKETVRKENEELTKTVTEIKASSEALTTSLNEMKDKVNEMSAKAGRNGGSVPPPEVLANVSPSVMRATMQHLVSKAIGDLKPEAIKDIEDRKSVVNEKISITKAVGDVLTTNLTGTAYRQFLGAERGYEAMQQVNFRDFFSVINSEFDTVNYPRVATPIGEGGIGKQTEGESKPMVDRDFVMITLNLDTLSGILKASRQALRNIIYLRGYLAQSLPNQLYVNENITWGGQLWTAATVYAPPAGTPVVNILLQLRTNLMKSNYGSSGFGLEYFVTPDVWQKLLLNTSPDGSWYQNPNTLTVSPTGELRYLGIRVNPVNWFTDAENRIMLVDTNKVAIVQSEAVNLRSTEYDDKDFQKNMITFRIEETAGLAIFRLDAVLKATYVPPTPPEQTAPPVGGE